jgi:tetratricopeptide (TPR) repeat protein
MPRKPRQRRFKTGDVAQVHESLRERFRAAGLGSIAAAEKALGLQEGYYRHYRREQTLDLGVLLATLDELGSDAGEFLVELFGGGAPPPSSPSPRSSAASPAERLASAVRKADVPPRPADRDESLRAELEAWLVRMDDLRYEDPDAALKELWSRADEIPRCLASRYLGACGSSYRMIGNLGDARECLLLALAWAQGDDDAVGDVLQRMSYVVAYDSFDEALELAERATGLYARGGNLPRLGQALVDQAKYLIHLEEPRKAKAALAFARRYVAESDERNQFAIEQFLVAISHQLGDIEACRKHIKAARKIAPNALFEGMLLNTLGDLCRDLKDFDEAAEAYREEIALVAGFPLHALLATVDLVYVLARQGRAGEAVAAARSVSRYAGCVSGSSAAEAALLDVYKSLCKGILRSNDIARLRNAVAGILEAPRTDTLADRLRRCRRLRGISRTQAAAESGVPFESFRKIESGVMPGTIYVAKLDSWLASCRPELAFAERLPAGADPGRKRRA